jgi:redox-sensing transcriptional repressor
LRKLKVPEVAIGRLAVYLRAMNALDLGGPGRKYISSKELGELAGVPAAQVRKDLALFGEFGKQGVGYDAVNLRRELRQILNCDRRIKVALAGAGELGDALLRHNIARWRETKDYPFLMAAAFDVDPTKIGTIIAGMTPVYHSSEIPERVRQIGLEMGIIAVPPEAAQKVAELMVSGGIKAILNFAPTKIVLPAGVQVVQADVSLELVRLAYYLKE